MASHSQKAPNKLISESSPYLLQHAYNPVNWYPWGEEALQKAQAEDKPIIVSIGYSACHWCHVMERECFENEQIAQIMNQHFVCIKVDREERPDVDAIYMDAVQAMGVHGGWPLNAFLMPDMKPFYGGTYFPPKDWAQILLNIANAYPTHKAELAESAEQFAESIALSEIQKYRLGGKESSFTVEELRTMFGQVATKFDPIKGGTGKAPKFPMPSIYLFLLHYYHITQDAQALAHVKLTLDQMAFGGIYDQIGGGFARYSVDEHWFAPHFEKMLYDNGQLVSLYAEAYNATREILYKEAVYQTIGFVRRELTSPEGGFYSALDADSEGEEGKFYVWTAQDWQQALQEVDLLGIPADVFTQYYHITTQGNWEHGNNILYREATEEAFAQAQGIDSQLFKKANQLLQAHLLSIREERIRPGLDDKILCSWNGLMLKGLVDAYKVFGEPSFLDMALQNANFLKTYMRSGNQLYHSYKNGKTTIAGYLEDYAFVMDAYIALYEATFDEDWLHEAKALAKYVVANFYDEKEKLFFFTDIHAEKLIARKKEIFDNVIPASNSAMAKNLHKLGLLLDIPTYTEIVDSMLAPVKKLILSDPQYMSNWASLAAFRAQSTAEIAIVGPEAEIFRKELEQYYYPNKVVAGTFVESWLPLLENRGVVGGKTTVYVCYNKTCKLPVYSVIDAIHQLADVHA
ncbi:thioredoxin domain-containing protein [Rhodocytophaga aerolata]|uniref:Thioredoxin domain-containing protein n=1 Tax=Rhodocytophaga aerolata TaxID=455078 RepID=A0ABT8R3A0_9BACT|nr:thioredoxin domain-containing protein [Rhodocytophaga aerolata]MDO1445242.1 thioredoxin domain-containing protein [Rhodocytophaga aerolata]